MKELLEKLNLKPNKRALEVADQFIKNNGGYEKFNQSYKNKSTMEHFQSPMVPPRIEKKQDHVPTSVLSSPTVVAPVPPPLPPQQLSSYNVNLEITSPKETPPKIERNLKPNFLDSITNFNQDNLKKKEETNIRVFDESVTPSDKLDIVDQLVLSLERMRKFIGKFKSFFPVSKKSIYQISNLRK